MRAPPRLHLVTDDAVLARSEWGARAAEVLRAGGDRIALHVRGPSTPGRALFETARALRGGARAAGALLIVNDRIDVALAVDADGVHLGERSVPPRVARRLLGRDRWVGSSVHRAPDLPTIRESGADYAFVGTIFPTPSHEGVPGIGTRGLRDAVRVAETLPLLGIGGIGADDVGPVLDAGAHGVAVMRGVWDRPDPGTAVSEYLQAIERAIE